MSLTVRTKLISIILEQLFTKGIYDHTLLLTVQCTILLTVCTQNVLFVDKTPIKGTSVESMYTKVLYVFQLRICLQCFHLMLTVCTQHVCISNSLVYKYAQFVHFSFHMSTICCCFLLTIAAMIVPLLQQNDFIYKPRQPSNC